MVLVALVVPEYNVAYYNESNLQPVHAADAWNLDRYLFTALAYIARAGKKNGSAYDDDVCKAIWFLAYAVTNDTDTAEACKKLVRDKYETAEEDAGHDVPININSPCGPGNVEQYRNCIQKLTTNKKRVVATCIVDDAKGTNVVENWHKGAIE